MIATKGRPTFKLSAHRIGIVFIIISFIWGLYLIKIQLDERNSQPDYLKGRIIHLSKEYIRALAREKGVYGIDGQPSTQQGVGDLKKATAVLLQSMLERIHVLEKQVEGVIVNSTLEFEILASQIKSLNTTFSLHLSNHSYVSANSCVIPDDPSYPECRQKVMWLINNWKSDGKFAQHGVNGSICSALTYLSEVEAWCPKSDRQVCDIPNDSAYPECTDKVQWMRKFWTSDPKFRSHGVDGGDCSILHYLSEVEHFCPVLEGRTLKSDCTIPKDPAFPSCTAKVAWMRNFWKTHECYAKDHGVNGTICSFLVYLSEVENWCPKFPGRVKPTSRATTEGAVTYLDLHRSDVQGLLGLLNDQDPIKFKWIKNRINQMWPQWLSALEDLKKKRDLKKIKQKKILVHIGLLANERALHFAANADKGGPLGELVQWSDLIASLYLLGHDVTVTADIPRLQGIFGKLRGPAKKPCPTTIKNDYDLIYLDYYGVKQMQTKVGQFTQSFKCKFRIVDSFGTEAQFNYAGFTEKVPGGSMALWGRHNLNLKQFMTMFPHSPDNSFLGFVVGEEPTPDPHPKKKKARALVYGKHYYMWKDLKQRSFLDVINKYMEIHATVGGGPESEIKKWVPSYVINHGVLPSLEVQKLLQDSMIFVGLGFPYEGPAPLEAIAHGCFFLNTKYHPPRNRINTPFFKDKPTLRQITSQHPYAEDYIGQPYVYTVDINDLNKIEAVMKEIMMAEPVSPYLPYEFTHKGMLERLHVFIENQNFCGQNLWPPLNALQARKGAMGSSCKETCHSLGLVCEPQYFPAINTKERMTRSGFPCNTTRVEDMPSLVAPGYRDDPPVCLRQAQNLLFSCTANSPTTKRLCPCRDFKKGQVALCSKC
ncbi:alpha-1,6-mannosylglycoprotein 6-beta-N-acetylglucosaminyltransferase A [Nematostella vectensis]|uniref:alpha-1,6-mannosylglycoprotein 6-beta-N-acetylglucosaminyltransferase A n=1 Tax=Nematostella vectensis TaxID=45351 RepID=UPI0020775DD4|nr:alpha-1,6-mannosylglycoprotein 6-beta-N-acetylglucosaminyltransferase A [Nematostella vectensis]